MRHAWVVATAAFLVASALVPVGAAAVGTQTDATAAVEAHGLAQTEANATWNEPGPFSLEELRRGGTQPPSTAEAVTIESERSLGTGGAFVKYPSLSLINSQEKELTPSTRVETNSLTFETSAYVDAVGEYEVVLVYWTEEKTTGPNGQERTYAAGQEVQRVGIDVDKGRDASRIGLQPHFDEPVQVSMWLERDGELVDGARWRFEHQSNPLAQSPAFSVDSEGDLFRWGGINILLPALVSLFVGRKIADHVFDRIVIGAQKGLGFWLILSGLIFVATAGFATFATAAVLANAPAVVGVVVGLIGLILMLGLRDADAEKAGFFQRRLDDDAVTPTGDDAASSRLVPNRIKTVVNRGGTLYAPAKGLTPMIARYWADPAAVPRSDLSTVDEGDADSDLERMYEVDPTSDEVLTHSPATLSFAPSLTVDVDEAELAEPPEGEGIASLPGSIAASLSNFSTRLNWSFLAVAVGGGALGYFAGMAVFGAQLVGVALAIVPVLVAGTVAVDGRMSVEPAPYHYSDVRATVATERQEYVARRTFEDLHSQIQDMDWQALDRAQSTVQTLRKEMAEKMDDMFGTDMADDVSDSSSSDDGNGDGPAPWDVDSNTDSGVADD
ncbi:hypothetical protein [Halorubrum lipolyticum]|uniref:Uncharacterized protein n=1 Tax=Halorubrum lipolyticum DSM 21995 TaxID=1227482 RepID=M0P561_9EURY|nr:hypothetical protein [Halorubrum lipolyticum]EMA64669.1 hypothetical protein C469_00395 [Halorubrum lipolyticum DSM 21995]